LANREIKDLEIDLTITTKPDLKKLQALLVNNPSLALREKELQKQQSNVALAHSNNYPDINLIAGYAYRQNFDDYMNLGLSMALPIYGTEDTKEQEQRALELSYRSQKEDTLIAINATLNAYYAQMLSSYTIYHIIEDDALPQIAHMFELSNSSISTGGDLFKYVDVLFDKLALEQKSINAIANYNKAEAEISLLAGEMK
jgi:hypothetical protein